MCRCRWFFILSEICQWATAVSKQIKKQSVLANTRNLKMKVYKLLYMFIAQDVELFYFFFNDYNFNFKGASSNTKTIGLVAMVSFFRLSMISTLRLISLGEMLLLRWLWVNYYINGWKSYAAICFILTKAFDGSRSTERCGSFDISSTKVVGFQGNLDLS